MPQAPLNKIYHVINIPEKEQAFIREMVDDLTDTFIKGKALRAAGEAAEGILSNPNLAFLVSGGILAALGAQFGADKLDDLMRYFGAAGRVLSGEATDEEKKSAVADMTSILGRLLPFGFLVDTP